MAGRVTATPQWLRKRSSFGNLVALYLYAAVRERILFIFPSE
jgi:hypothetical protein